MFRKSALILATILTASCNLLIEKLDEQVTPDIDAMVRKQAVEYAATFLTAGFSGSVYGARSYLQQLQDELYYSLSGPAFLGEWEGVLIAQPSLPGERQKLVLEATAAADAVRSGAQFHQLRLEPKQKMYVFFVDDELARQLAAGDVVRYSKKERLTEEEFRREFPQGEEGSYQLFRKPNGDYLLVPHLAKTGTLIGKQEAMEYVQQHGQPWTFEKSEAMDDETGKNSAYYYVERVTVDFDAEKVPLVDLVRDNASHVVGVAIVKPDLSTDFVSDQDEVTRLVGSVLKKGKAFDVER